MGYSGVYGCSVKYMGVGGFWVHGFMGGCVGVRVGGVYGCGWGIWVWVGVILHHRGNKNGEVS